MEIFQILEKIELFQQSVVNSFNELKNGILEKFNITEYQITRLNQPQLTSLLQSYLSISKLREYVQSKIEQNTKSFVSILQTGTAELDLEQLQYNLPENEDIKKSAQLCQEGNQLFRLNQYDKALEKINESIQINPKNLQALHSKVEQLKQMQKMQEAKEIEKKIQEVPQKEGNQQSIKGKSLMELGQYNEALLCYDNQLSINQKDFASIVSKAECLLNLNRGREALVYYDKALELKEDDINATYGKGTPFHQLAQCLINLNQFSEAYIVIKDNNDIKFQLTKGTFQQNQAICLMNLYKIQQALASFEEYLNVDEANVVALIGKGRCLKWLEKDIEAQASFDKVQKIRDDSPQIMFFKGIQNQNLGESLRLMNKINEALEIYDKLLKLKHYNHIDALSGKGELCSIIGLCLLKQGEFNEAVKYFEQALQMDFTSLLSLYGIATCLLKKKEYSSALNYYDKALQSHPQHIPTLVGKYECLVSMGQHELAQKQQDLVLQIYSNALQPN